MIIKTLVSGLIGIAITAFSIWIFNKFHFIIASGMVGLISFTAGTGMFKRDDSVDRVMVMTLSSYALWWLIASYTLLNVDVHMTWNSIMIVIMTTVGFHVPIVAAQLIKRKVDEFTSYIEILSVMFISTYGVLMSMALFISGRIAYRPEKFDLHSINFVPFRTIVGYESSIHLLGNIILFIPIGLVLSTLIKNGRIRRIAAVLIPVFIEVAQFFTRTGVADVDDLILNSFGIAIGSLLVCLVRRRLEATSSSLL
ncbi:MULTISPECIES: VanZ family protein [unclassified Fusibacter]|uniref:VanZ family protein n=1 Tax=unclassified Fusibacter TaxID=2624464 RepID=UPI001012063B|nr:MULTISPECIES: VanZ family protein [unclassified Fusibacter]MCK8059106.1 VanZ family protein [Fusibacter sp. A2]NPE22515.1 VanZ family protein [Fusibacter sp. A1]RXV60618.1 VanZ family protein [Fusibacter sp. A1]